MPCCCASTGVPGCGRAGRTPDRVLHAAKQHVHRADEGHHEAAGENGDHGVGDGLQLHARSTPYGRWLPPAALAPHGRGMADVPAGGGRGRNRAIQAQSLPSTTETLSHSVERARKMRRDDEAHLESRRCEAVMANIIDKVPLEIATCTISQSRGAGIRRPELSSAYHQTSGHIA